MSRINRLVRKERKLTEKLIRLQNSTTDQTNTPGLYEKIARQDIAVIKYKLKCLLADIDAEEHELGLELD